MNNEELIDKYSDMVKNIANKLYHRNSAYDACDLMQVGYISLMSAYKKFDPDRGFKPSTMLYISIKRGMYKFIQRNNPHLNIFKKSCPEYRTIMDFWELLPSMDSQDLDIIVYRSEKMSHSEIADLTGLSVSQIKYKLAKIRDLKCIKKEFCS